jgi:protein-S-isoprenylcysteine O-methyltransferase Ste14
MQDAAVPAPARPFEGRERLTWLLSTTALAAVFAVFAIVHFRLWLESGALTGIGVVVQETLVVALFIVRRRASATTRSPLAWLATGIGAFGVLALRPGGHAVLDLAAVWAALQVIAAVGYVASLGFLGRAFGIVPAYRGLRTGGPYRLVRHPVYAAYVVGNIGYLLESPTWWNASVLLMQMAAQLVRIQYEEAVLATDPEYVSYRQHVRWRLVPFVY